VAIAITRTAWTDDDGSGTTGTVLNNAVKTALYDQVDAILNATRTADLLFTDATYDIGKSGATRPRDIVASRHVSLAGLLSVAGFGTHTFSAGGAGVQLLTVENTTSGAANFARVLIQAGTAQGILDTYPQGYTTGSYDVQSGTACMGLGAGGLSIGATHASGDIRGYAGGSTQKFAVKAADGHTYTDNGSVYSLSDLRFKAVAGPFSRGLAEILALTPSLYQHTPDSGMPMSAGPFVSLGAQDVRPLIPEAVSEGTDGRLGLGIAPLVYATMNAVKTLHARLAALEVAQGAA
jgi:hypothetical protein